MKNIKLKKGFSLPEVIIAITIVTLVIVAATNLLVSSMRANTGNVNRIIAFNLAQEGLEGFRNVRDNYWMHNLDWLGEAEKSFVKNSGEIKDDGFYKIKKNTLSNKPECNENQFDLNGKFMIVKQKAPWILEKIPGTSNALGDNSRLYIKEEYNGIKRYTHNSADAQESRFSRWLEIQVLPTGLAGCEEEICKVAVTAVVQWQEGSVTKDLRIPTIFTNWKEGPL